MKPAVLTSILLLATGVATHAQLSFLPQVGFEQNRSTINYNHLSASGVDGNFRANLKMDYRFKGGHGPYAGIGTSAAPVTYVFNNAGVLQENLDGSDNNLRFRLEAGYQYSSKPIQLGKSKSATTTAGKENYTVTYVEKRSCGSVTYQARCVKKNTTKTPTVNNSLNMRIQPSVGIAYLPASQESIKHTANGYEYNATNWNTAVVPAMGFEFAKGRQRLFTLSVFYTQPLSLEGETVSSTAEAKPVMTTLSPKASTWGLTLGVPFSFTSSEKAKTSPAKKEVKRVCYKRCNRI
jgi:hypothetical protein